MDWTTDQQKVIDLRDRNILVSAAAGSGKTAVLVQRIINMITDKDNPVNIDRLLIVTFTKAAAAEMKERITAAIEKAIEKEPDNTHLQKQTLLIHNAQITTIDSFCLNIVKNYFNEIDLNPGFRIADENELSLLKTDTVKNVLEKYYDKADTEFLDFVDKYALTKSDNNIEEMIIKLYNFSVSFPWPKEWLSGLLDTFIVDKEQNNHSNVWITMLLSHIKSIITDLKITNESMIRICNKEDGPIQYQDNLFSDADIYDEILACNTIFEMENVFNNIKFSALSRKKSDASEYNKELVKKERNKNKDVIKKIKEKYFFQSIEGMFNDINASMGSMKALVDLTMDFYEELRIEKEERNIIDFGDMEHFALQILIDRIEENGVMIEKKSDVAAKLSEFFHEILVDEYQDSNYVQETIINAISKVSEGKPNVFMVGDVKQSIYKFRMAKPELFMDKFDKYTLEDSLYQRIDLKKNFRSRGVVLEGINYLFEQIMIKNFGNIEYDELAALYTGAKYPNEEGVSENCELIIFGENDVENAVQSEEYADNMEDDSIRDEEIEYSKIEMEVKLIANRIKQLVNLDNGLKVTAKDDEGNTITKNAEYKDIAILLRGLGPWSEVINDVFSSEGIPVNIESRTGYFSTIEVRTMLSFLKILNNPRQDIPLTTILLSPIGGFYEDELAQMRIKMPDGDIYEMLQFIATQDNDKKVADFLQMLETYRKEVPFTPIHDMINKVMKETGYYSYVYAMPDGERRRLNLDMLVEKAIQFESTSYKGLFNFIRYMEKINKYNIDMGEAGSVKDNDNFVKVMTIHKSKGLEFPIVFVSGLGKKFNTSDSKEKIVIHSEYGLAPDYIDKELKIKSPTLIKSVISDVIKRENIEEEIRILYVALTRAKEKLILTGGVKDLEKSIIKYSSILLQDEEDFYYQRLCNAGSYFDLVIPALMRHECFSDILESYDINYPRSKQYVKSNWIVNIANIVNTTKSEVLSQIKKIVSKEEILSYNTENIYDKDMYENLCMLKNYTYKYQMETMIKGKVSVSELKKSSQYEVDEEVESIIAMITDDCNVNEDEIIEFNSSDDCNISKNESIESKIINDNKSNKFEAMFDNINENKTEEELQEISFEPTIPIFIKGEQQKEITASESGTLYHKIMQLLDFNNADDIIKINEQLERICNKGYITEEQKKSINVKKILKFTQNDIVKRINEANKKCKVKREQPFVFSLPATELGLGDTKESILIQGIIDMYFEEDNEIVLLDYKTDRVYKNDEDILKKRYKKQMDYYAHALQTITGKKVKEKLIYSFSLGKIIGV